MEQPQGNQAVGGEKEKEELEQPRGQTRSQIQKPAKEGVKHIDQGQRQQAPEQGVERADFASQVAGLLGVVPELDPGPHLIKEGHPILNQRGQQTAGQKDGQGVIQQGSGHVKDRQSPEAVNRAEGEKEQALASMAPAAMHPGVEQLQQKAQKAVEKEWKK